MKQLYDDLWQCEIYSSGVLNTHAYFLRRDQGNVLFYNTSSKNDLDQIEKLGGIRYQILTHRDEVGESLRRIKERFGSQLCTGILEAEYTNKVLPVDISFKPSDTDFENLRVLFTPGHSDGSTCYFYESPFGKNYLFTGDTFFLNNGDWSTFILSGYGGTKQAMIYSLKKLRELQPEVVMSSGFVGDFAYREVTVNEWKQAIDRELANIGQDFTSEKHWSK